MGRRFHRSILREPGGFSLLEVLFVLALLGVCAALGAVGGARALEAREAKGAAQGWQAAAGWAQVGVVWFGGRTQLDLSDGSLALRNDRLLCAGDLDAALPGSAVTSNIPRWLTASGARITFGGAQASPDSGGSLFFGTGQASYRVVVRPESGLTVRTLTEGAP
jgi:prepilin-type N-terminal cleavage/methylation domain-containing protein